MSVGVSRVESVPATLSGVTTADGITLALAGRAAELGHPTLPGDIAAVARQCVLDAVGVALAGSSEPAAAIVLAELREQGGAPAAGVIGHGDRLPASAAALANGTAAHALDFDDVHMAVPGHLSAATVPALLALAENVHASGAELIAALVAGFEVGCRVGRLMAPGHYAAGFHATGTIGAIAAAAAGARLLALDTAGTAHAMGIATAQTAGLKSMLGTMCKPLHAGNAAATGVLSARLAARGFTARTDALECAQGFCSTHSDDFVPEAALVDAPGGFYIRQNLFKYHAACMLTHAPIEAVRALREAHGIVPEQVESVRLRVDRMCEAVCAYPEPRTGLEAKFSLPYAAALALTAHDTGDPATYSDAMVGDRSLAALAGRTRVEFQDGWEATVAEVEVHLASGRVLLQAHDAGQPAADVDSQGRRLEEKFLKLAAPLLGHQRATRVVAEIADLDAAPDVDEVVRLWSL